MVDEDHHPCLWLSPYQLWPRAGRMAPVLSRSLASVGQVRQMGLLLLPRYGGFQDRWSIGSYQRCDLGRKQLGLPDGQKIIPHISRVILVDRGATLAARAALAGLWNTDGMEAILAALVGGILAIGGGLVGVFAAGRSERSRWRRDAQLRVNTELLSALQALISRMNDLARLNEKQGEDAKRARFAYSDAAIGWNSARHAALLVSPPKVAALVQGLDDEKDVLLGRAMAKQWSRIAFREERLSLGRLAANYLDASRAEAGWPPLQLPSLWMWNADKPSEVRSPPP